MPAPANPDSSPSVRVIRVLIVDDEALVRTGFHLILDAQPDIRVVGEAADGGAVIDLLQKSPADVILMDIQMKHVSGLDATKAVLAKFVDPPRVIVLTTFDRNEYVYEALRSAAAPSFSRTHPLSSWSMPCASWPGVMPCSIPRLRGG